MTKDGVDNLQEEALKALDREVSGKSRSMAAIESEISPSIEKRLAVGYSVAGKKDYRLELRVHRKSGLAFAYGEQLQQKYGADVNVVVVDAVTTPAHVDVSTTAHGVLSERQSELRPGLSISRVDAKAGTLGVLVETNAGVALMSAGHVIAQSGDAENGDWIYQPGKPDAMPLKMELRVAKLSNSVELSSDELNTLDVAIAHLRNGVQHAGNEFPKLSCPVDGKSLGKILSFKDLEGLGKEPRVAKVGRTSGYTQGVLTALNLRRLSVRTARGNHNFGELFEITWEDKPFSKPGDSGACVFSLDGLDPFGIHFASDAKNRSYACSLINALSEFKATLI